MTDVSTSTDAELPKTRQEAKQMKFIEILPLVCAEFCVTRESLEGESRARTIARPRQVLMYLALMDTGRSQEWVGDHLGGRDHTTVLHGFRKIGELLDEGDENLRSAIERIRSNYPP